MTNLFLAPIFMVMGFTIPMDANISYYCNCEQCCGIWADGLTASGTVPEQGRTIAADKRFDFGTEIVIGDKTYIVEDRGGAIKGNKIDIYLDSHSECLQRGRHTETVQIKIAP
jgi:3D (Asp-Asp-Asp) domain-containing protein